MRNFVLVLFLSLFLGSCSRPVGTIIAEVENGKVMFHIRNPGFFFDKVFGWDDEDFTISNLYVIDNKKIIWAFTMQGQALASYPIAYGQKITSSDVIFGPEELQRNMKYEIFTSPYYDEQRDKEAIDIDNINYDAKGLFRINSDGSLINLKSD